MKKKKKCRTCGATKPLDEFYCGAGSHGRRGSCVICVREQCAERRRLGGEDHKKKAAVYAKAWRLKNLDKAREISRANQRRHVQELRAEVRGALGDKCSRCTVVDPVLLHIDHVFDDGAVDRFVFGSNQTAYLNHVLSCTHRYQLLCPNCNHRKRLSASTGLTTKASVYSARTVAKFKDEAVSFLGGVCVLCGEEDREVLCFDHKAGSGRVDRDVTRGSKYKDVVRSPGKYQLLCHNCNWTKRHRCKEHGNVIY